MALPVRAANEADIPQAICLVKQLWTGMGLTVEEGEWESKAADFLKRSWLAGTARLLVADDPDVGGHLVAIGMATILDSAPTIWLPNGKMGYLQWFYTVPKYRRRGIASAMIDDLIAWFRSNEVQRAQLHGDAAALSLYERKGFHPASYANYWWSA